MGTSGFLLNVLIFSIAGFATWRMKPKNPKDAAFMWGGWVIAFLLVRFSMGAWLPQLFINTQASTAAHWDPVYDQAAGTANQAGSFAKNVIGIGGEPVFTPEESGISYLPENTAVTEIASPPAETAATPAPPEQDAEETPATGVEKGGETTVLATSLTVTMTRKMALYEQLNQAARTGDRAAGAATVASLQTLDPDDPQAAQAARDLEAADLRVRQYQALSNIPRSVFIDKAAETHVRDVLTGHSYVIVNSGAQITNVACQEVATVRDVTEGWTYGVEFQIKRCYLSQFRAKDTGDRFTVR